MKNRNNNTGFTLMELLFVVGIIAVLAAIAVPNFLEAQIRAKVTRVRSDFAVISVAMEAYKVDNRRYPYVYTPITSLDISNNMNKIRELINAKKKSPNVEKEDPEISENIPQTTQQKQNPFQPGLPAAPQPPSEPGMIPEQSMEPGMLDAAQYQPSIQVPTTTTLNMEPGMGITLPLISGLELKSTLEFIKQYNIIYSSNNHYAFSSLTTPVAYCPNSVFRDTFHYYSGGWTGRNYLDYCYINLQQINPEGITLPHLGMNKSFLLYSPGPDTEEVLQYPVTPIGEPFPYDPTNGTVSKGDLYYAGN